MCTTHLALSGNIPMAASSPQTDGGQYKCQANITIPLAAISNLTNASAVNVTVQGMCVFLFQTTIFVALFPNCPYLQYLIACSMQVWRGRPGKFGHVWLYQVDRRWTYGGQCQTIPSTWMINSINAALSALWPLAFRLTVKVKTSRFFIGHCPPCVYPLSTWCNRVWPNRPELPSPCLQTLEMRMTWGRGYNFVCHIFIYLQVFFSAHSTSPTDYYHWFPNKHNIL